MESIWRKKSRKVTSDFGIKTNWLTSMGGLCGQMFREPVHPVSSIINGRKGRVQITAKQVADALMRLDILTAQIGNARIRKMHKDPLKQFIKAVEKEMTK